MTDDYRARKALSAGMAWTIIDQCPAQAWHESPWNPGRVEEQSTEFDIGRATHLLVLEPAELANRIVLVPHKTYQTKEARDIRDQAYIDGKTPLRWKDWELVNTLRDKLEHSDAADLLFGEGLNEHAYYWTWDGVPCKAKADRVLLEHGMIIDLKTAATASPGAFQRAMIRDGHHLRAAWYIDGWCEQSDSARPKYLYVVIAKTPPHLVSVYQLPEEFTYADGVTRDGPLVWGRRLYQKALRIFRECEASGCWHGYGAGEKIQNVNLPAFAENLLNAQERAGEFDDEVGYE